MLGRVVGAFHDRHDTAGLVVRQGMSEELAAVAVEIVEHDGFREGVGIGGLCTMRRDSPAKVAAVLLDALGNRCQAGRAGLGRDGRGARPASQCVVAQAQHVAQFAEGRLAACQARGDGRHAAGGLAHGLQHGRGPLQDALLATGSRPGQARGDELLEAAAALVEVPVGEGEWIARLLAAIALQDPQQQGRQVPLAPGAVRRAGLRPQSAQQCPQAAPHLEPGQAAAEGSVVGIHQLATDGGQEMEVAHQIAAGRLAAGRDSLGDRAPQIAHEGERGAEGVERGLDGGAQFGSVLGTDADSMQHPAAPAVEAQEQPAPAAVAGGIEVQGVALSHSGAQGRGALAVQLLQQLQEAVAEGGQRAVRESDGALGELGADLMTLAHVVVALQSGPGDQIVAVALPGGCQVGQLPGELGRGGTARAAAAEFPRPDRARREGGEHAGLALLAAQAGAAVGALEDFGWEVKQRQGGGALQGARDAVGRPAGGAGVGPQRAQQSAGPPFWATCSRSKRVKTAMMSGNSMGGAWPRK